jgi:hypothetical protein
MIEQGISVLKISYDLNINPSLFSMYLNGWRKMPDHLKEEVTEYLGTEPNKIFDDQTVKE